MRGVNMELVIKDELIHLNRGAAKALVATLGEGVIESYN